MANGHILYMKAEGNRCIGFIKVGQKKLFVRGRSGDINEITPLAVLDFYVDSQVQRGGHGRKLFDTMLSYQNAEAHHLAYDRPSIKLISFLAKHFSLKDYVKQNNNYVVFDDYFTKPPQTTATNASASGQQSEAQLKTHTRLPSFELNQPTSFTAN